MNPLPLKVSNFLLTSSGLSPPGLTVFFLTTLRLGFSLLGHDGLLLQCPTMKKGVSMKNHVRLILPLVLLFLCLTGSLAAAASQQELLDQWKPKFDPSGAKYTYILSNVDHPAIEGIAVGYHIRDRLWERSNGQIYVDFRPFAQMGGEKDVISKLKMGAVQGMLCSSVAAVNVASTLGIVNLPFVIDSFDKLERFRNEPELFGPFSQSAEAQGVKVVDFTGYGTYGWATTTPVRTLADAKNTNFRVAQAPVNADIYKAWSLKFTVMPWPDVPQALQTGVISGLDHTPIVCNITKKFTIAKYFTELDYAQGLFVHLVNKRLSLIHISEPTRPY